MRLTVTRSSIPQLPAGVVREFDGPGFTLGRQNADCLLPDSEKRVSRLHAEVTFSGGRYTLRDTSHNGTLVNGAQVGDGNVAMLSHGDTLEIGPYLLTVGLISTETDIELPGLEHMGLEGTIEPLHRLNVAGRPVAFPPSPAFGGPSGGQEDVDPLAALDRPEPATNPGFGGMPDPFGVGNGSASPPLSSGSAPHPDSVGTHAHFAPQIVGAEQIPSNYEITGFHAEQHASNVESPPAAPPPAPKPTLVSPPGPGVAAAPAYAPPPPTVVADAAWQAFLQGAGMRPEDLGPNGDAISQLARAGSLFRLLIEGLMELLQARARLKAEFRMTQTLVARADNNPLKFSGNAEAALFHMLGRPAPGYMSAEQAVAEGMRDVKEHELATLAGVHAALDTLVKRFDPAVLEKQFKRTAGGGLSFLNRKGRLWRTYCEFYDTRVRDVDEHFNELWGDEFNQAYERLTSAADFERGEPYGDRPPPRGRRR